MSKEGYSSTPKPSSAEKNLHEGAIEIVTKKPNEVALGDVLNLYNGPMTVIAKNDESTGGLTIQLASEVGGKRKTDSIQYDRDEKYTDEVEVIVSGEIT